MKTHRIEIQHIKAGGTSHGLVNLRVDALVLPQQPVDGIEPSTVLSMSVENARVLLMLLKQQIAATEPRKGKSQR